VTDRSRQHLLGVAEQELELLLAAADPPLVPEIATRARGLLRKIVADGQPEPRLTRERQGVEISWLVHDYSAGLDINPDGYTMWFHEPGEKRMFTHMALTGHPDALGRRAVKKMKEQLLKMGGPLPSPDY
jgi:hypothetical protein